MTQDEFVAVAIRFAELFPDQGLKGAAEAFYDGFDCPSHPPLAVKRAIVLKFLDDLPTARRVLRELTYVGLSNYYAFTHAGMYFGVAPDGYIHT